MAYASSVMYNNMEDRKYKKVELAKIQLDQAMNLFLNENDYISSITLAAAAEELFGKQLKKNNPNAMHELDRIKRNHKEISIMFGCPDIDDKKIIAEENYAKDHLKHYIEEEIMVYPKSSAIHHILRAINNYWWLYGEFTEKMQEFRQANA